MSTTRTRRQSRGEPTDDTRPFAWLRALGPRGRRAFGGAFGGFALDSYDFFTLPLSMVAIAAYFGGSFRAVFRPGLLRTTLFAVLSAFSVLAYTHIPAGANTLVGFLAEGWGVGGALVFGAIGYGVAVLALLGLPETRGRELL